MQRKLIFIGGQLQATRNKKNDYGSQTAVYCRFAIFAELNEEVHNWSEEDQQLYLNGKEAEHEG